MKFFIDSADVNEVRELAKSGLVDGVTTNPSLIAKEIARASGEDSVEDSGGGIHRRIGELCALLDGPVSAEVVATDFSEMYKEGKSLSKIAKNVAVKVPLTESGLRCCHALSLEGIDVNVTLCFSSAQALLAAKSGARFVSPFIGRLDDIGHDGLQLIEEILELYSHYTFRTEVLVASVRSIGHVVASARMGAPIATLPPKIFRALYKHPLTDSGLEAFLSDWRESKQSIL